MRLDFPPKYTETIGAVKIHSMQKVYEIDSGYGNKTKNSQLNNSTISFGNKKLSKICTKLPDFCKKIIKIVINLFKKIIFKSILKI